MKINDVIIDMHQGINTVADKVEYLDFGIPIIQSKNFTKGYLDLEDVRYLGEEDEKKYIEKYNPHVGDILMANIGTIGKSYVITEEQRFLIAWNAFLIKPNADKIKSEYLKFYFDFLASTHYFDGLLTGGTVKFINKKKIGDIVVPDKTITEQVEICDVLSKVEQVIIKRQQEIELLDNLIKARFVELFGTLDNPAREFEKATLKELCNKITDGKHGGCTSEEGTQRYFVGAREIYDDEVHYDTAPEINVVEFEKDYKRCNIEIGDFLIVNTGATIGKSAIAIDERTEHTLLQKSVALLKVKKDLLNPVFLKWCYRVNTRMYMVESASAQPNLLLSKINGTVIYVPDIELQNQFAEFVKQVDKSKFS